MQIFIDAAVCVVTQVELCMSGKSISDSCITSAITFLAAHMMSQSAVGTDSAIVKSERIENITVQYVTGNYSSSGVLSTPYGNNANALTGGCLQEVDKREAGFWFAGGSS